MTKHLLVCKKKTRRHYITIELTEGTVILLSPIWRSHTRRLHQALVGLPYYVDLIPYTVFSICILVTVPCPQGICRIQNLYDLACYDDEKKRAKYAYAFPSNTSKQLMMRRRQGSNLITSKIPWPKLLSRNALHSGCLSQQNLPLAGPEVKFRWQTPPNSGWLSPGE